MSNGQDCTCSAWSANECACGADWTPQEVYDLRAENNRLKAELAEAKKDAERYRWLIKNAVREKNLGDRYIEFHCDFENWNNVTEAIDAAMKGK